MILITTIGEDVELLEKFISYYSNFKFDSYIFIINNSGYDNVCQKVLTCFNNILKSFKPEISFKKMDGNFSEDKKVKLELECLRTYKREWIIYVDLDEFIYFPGGIEKRIKLAESFSFDYIEGKMIDRVSVKGNLKDFISKDSLEEQYPIGCKITKNVCKAWDKKIVAAKSHLKVGGGHHVFLNDYQFNGTFSRPYKEELSPWSFGVEIHHFKWRNNLIEKMKKQIISSENEDSLKSWKKEQKIFLNFYDFCGNFYNIEDKNIFKNGRIDLEEYYIENKLGV